MNGDGSVDLLMLDSQAGYVLLMYGKGDGTFAPPLALPTGASAGTVVPADLDGDGLMDLAVANGWSPFVTLLYQRR